jgi:hypothetical protein
MQRRDPHASAWPIARLSCSLDEKVAALNGAIGFV